MLFKNTRLLCSLPFAGRLARLCLKVAQEGDFVGETGFFGWSSEPGSYRWNIQRRGGVFYVKAPRISKSFFIPRRAFLDAVSGLTAEW